MTEHTQPSWPSLSQSEWTASHMCSWLEFLFTIINRMPFAFNGCTVYYSKSSSFLMIPFLWNKYFSRFLKKRRGKSFFFLKYMILTQGSNPPLFCFLRWQVGSLPLVPPRKLQKYWQKWLKKNTKCAEFLMYVNNRTTKNLAWLTVTAT